MNTPHLSRRTSLLLATSAFALGIAALIVSCVSTPKSRQAEVAEEWPGFERGVASVQPTGPDVEPTTYVEQNWTPEERERFYRTAQGSHIMPLKFALAMERADSKEPFLGKKNLSRYGFVLQNANPQTNPYGLPVGFTIDGMMRYQKALGIEIFGGHSVEDTSKPRMLGINCAVCHTTNIHYKGQALRIDGGQTLVHFQDFIRDMDVALRQNFEDKEKLERFLDRVIKRPLPNEPQVTDREALKAELESALKVRADWTNLNHDGIVYGHGFNDTKFQHGPGRIDAFAAIFNEVLARDLGDPRNAGETDAPVSAPVIWDAPQHDKVQWNGLASNDPNNGGPMARNLGQVLGVFGRVHPKEAQTLAFGKGLQGYCTTARRKGLDELEKLVGKVWSPLWPEQMLGQLDQGKIARGRKLFEQRCLGCHQDINRSDENRKIIARMIPMDKVGTEKKFNENALKRQAYTNELKGRLTRVKQGRPLEEKEPAASVLKHVVAGSLLGTISVLSCADSVDVDGKVVGQRLIKVAEKAFSAKEAQKDDDPDPKKRVAALVADLARYKARPLNGIWASPPFLHNGSVNSLYDILLPPSERQSFYLGCDEYDPVKAGLACTKENGGFFFDTSIYGNTAVGHDYGPKSEDERMDLLEYLKSI